MNTALDTIITYPQKVAPARKKNSRRTDIAHTAEGDNWSGKQTTEIRDHYSQLRAVLQKKASKGTRSSKYTEKNTRELSDIL